MKNYHTHTYRCHHAIGRDEDYILAAIDGGYTELGFSDHSPWKYKSGYISGMRMAYDQIGEYCSSLSKLREKYKDRISIKIGLECEYFPSMMDDLKKMIKEYHIDYIILGHHYDTTDETGSYYGFPLKSYASVKRYVSQVLIAMDTGLYSYVAHPDVIFYKEDSIRHLKEMEKICIKAKQLDMPLEFNLLGFKAHRHYPSMAFLKLCAKHHNKIIIGCDAHEPNRLRDIETYIKAKSLILSMGLEFTEDIPFFTDIDEYKVF